MNDHRAVPFLIAALLGVTCMLAVLANPGCSAQRLAAGRRSEPADDPAPQPGVLRRRHDPEEVHLRRVGQSPPLEWSGVPTSARALVLICDDPDAPMGTWSHWVVFNLPPQVKGLKEGVPAEETISEASMENSEPGEGRPGGKTRQERLRQDRLRRTVPARAGPTAISSGCMRSIPGSSWDSTATRADVLKANRGTHPGGRALSANINVTARNNECGRFPWSDSSRLRVEGRPNTSGGDIAAIASSHPGADLICVDHAPSRRPGRDGCR